MKSKSKPAHKLKSKPTFITKDQGEHGYDNTGAFGVGQLAEDKMKVAGKTKEMSVNSFRHGYRK